MYTVDYFIEKFSKIPDAKWMTGEYRDEERCCALGHCGMEGFKSTKESDSLASLFTQLKINVWLTNDGFEPNYQQETPKQRILAALYEIKKLNQGTEPSTERRNEVQSELQRADITKELSQIEIISETSDKILSHAKEFSVTH